MEKKNKIANILRVSIMTLIVIVSITLGQLHQMSKAFLPIDAFCPFGGLESLYAVFAYGMFLQRIAWGSLVMLFATVVIAIVFRRSFCGYICPLGSIQDFFGYLGDKILKKRYTIPAKVDKYLRYTKYLVLALVLYLTYATSQLVIRPFDPWAALHHINSVEVFEKFAWGFGILMLTFVGSFFYKRFFCKYLCPMGAFLAILSKIGITRIKRDADVCTSCGICDRECPVNIKVSEVEQVKSAECISCNKCLTSCPQEGALVIGTKKSKKGMSALTVISIVLVIFILIVSVTMSIGMLQVSKIPKGFPLKSYGLYIGTDYISEKNNLAEVCYVYGIPAEYMMFYYDLEEEDFFVPMQDIDFDYNIVVDLIESAPQSGCGDDGC